MADVSIDALIVRVAAIQQTIPGILNAYASGPPSLPPNELPLFVNFVGPATFDWAAIGSQDGIELLTILMRLYVAPWGDGLSAEVEGLCKGFFDPVRDTFSGRPKLGLTSSNGPLAGIRRRAALIGHNGLQPLGYAGETFAGVEFRLQVPRLVSIDYEDYE